MFCSLRDWVVLTEADKRYHYRPQANAFTTRSDDLEGWMLRCALTAHPVEEMPVAELLHLPARFPFRFTLTAYRLREMNGSEIQRQGLGLEMVRSA